MVATGHVYLGSPFYSDAQRARVKKAQELLAQNETVVRVHFPFDYEFVDPDDPNPKAGIPSLKWQLATYQNDLTGLVNASVGVFLYDMDQLDDGSAFEIGYMRALHKPVVLVPFTEHPEKEKKMNLMLAQGVTTLIDGNSEFEKLASYDFNSCMSDPVTGYRIF
ncbi:nucleoside 2-deoxyribosyltransferase [Lactobacillus psittaci]|uniref:Nucleoside deoxyribosyltransferase n=1 Tax=Lactobacillus psittaci DSM 15354 TaxID=1122152 RepID=A0A0R1RXR3_9LACO|nr:nucleoside 2-deoxyribosyltransferase [Lactobacillus psittaci]KRL61807.1 nucleoside deoxyribosyltransferase [Lactobacillus psittaci DSM 15354]